MPYLSIHEAAEDIRSGLTTPTELVAEALTALINLIRKYTLLSQSYVMRRIKKRRRQNESNAPAYFVALCTASLSA